MDNSKKSEKKPKIGLALGGGTVRGLAFIGILKVLEKEGIKLDYLAGTSAGAVIAAAYAAGNSVHDLERIAYSTKWHDLLDFTKPKKGFIEGKKIERYLNHVFKRKTFEQLNIPLTIIATEVDYGTKAVFYTGSVTKAVRASISLPAIFKPYRIGNKEYMDGSLIDPVPVDILKEMGADIIIAVDLTVDIAESYVSSYKTSNFVEKLKERFIEHQIKFIHDYVEATTDSYLVKNLIRRFNLKNAFLTGIGKKLPRIMEIYLQATEILMNELTKEKLRNPVIDIVIAPKFEGVNWVELDKIGHIMEAGEIASRKQVGKIKKMLNK
ncbi:patatin-like phospholipase family protein [Candidatus Woesearchaeota archaeon]|nr:patatin-like phospholipase family protein [Candidatus Woesearchaeota archaeon]